MTGHAKRDNNPDAIDTIITHYIYMALYKIALHVQNENDVTVVVAMKQKRKR